jgi:hypothetical protein
MLLSEMAVRPRRSVRAVKDGLQFDLRPFETQRLAEPQSRVQKQQSYIREWRRASCEICHLLSWAQDRFAAVFASKQSYAGNALNLLPLVREAQQPPKRRQFAVDRSGREWGAAPELEFAAS